MKSWTKSLMVALMLVWSTAALGAEVTQSFDVSGWSCGSCSDKTIKAVKGMEGVREAKADTEGATLTVTYDDTAIKRDKIVSKVKELGFKCSLKDAPKKS